MPQFDIDIVAKFAQFQDALDKVGKNTENASRRLEGAFKGTNKAIEAFTKIATGAFVGHEVAEFIASVVEAGVEFEKAQNRVRAALKATGNAAGITGEEIEEFSKTLSQKSNFDDTGVKNAAAVLLRFKAVQGETFKETLSLLPDVASALGTDLPEAAQKFGLALQDPVNGLKGLRTVMSKLSEEQADQIARLVEQGKLFEAQAIIIDQVKSSVGGLAEELHSGLTGATADASKAWDNFKQTLSQTPAVKVPVVETLNFISNAFKDLEEDLDRIKNAKGVGGTLSEIMRSLDVSRETLDKDRGFKLPDVVAPTDAGERSRAAAARAGEEKANEQRDIDKRYSDAQRAVKQNVELAKSGLASETAATRQASQEREAILQDSYGKGLITTQEYYDGRLKIQQDALAKEIAGIDRIIAAEQKQLASPKTTADQKVGINADIGRLRADRARKVTESGDLGAKSTRAQTDETQRLLDVETEVKAALAEQNGELAKAERLRAGISGRARQQDFAKGAKIGLDPADLAQLEKQEEAQRQLNQLNVEAGRVRDELANKERDYASAVQAGQLNESDALTKTNAARAEAGAQLDTITQKAAVFAAETKNPGAVQAVKNQASEVKALSASYSDAAQSVQKLQQAQRHIAVLQGKEAIAEQDIQTARANGAITTQDALAKTDAARQKSLAGMREDLAKQQEALANAAPGLETDEARLRVDQTRASIDALAASAHQVKDQFKGVFEDSLVDPLVEFVNGTKTAGQAFDDFAKNVEQSLLKIAAKNVAEQIFGGLLGGSGGGGGGGGGDSTAGLVGMFAQLFAAADGGVMTSRGPMQLRRYSRGGVATSPQLAMFGEGSRPEAYVPLPDGRSIPVKMHSGNSQRTQQNNISFVVNTPDAGSFRRSQNQILTELQSQLQRAGARR